MKKKKILVSFMFCFMLLFAVFMGKGEAHRSKLLYVLPVQQRRLELFIPARNFGGMCWMVLLMDNIVQELRALFYSIRYGIMEMVIMLPSLIGNIINWGRQLVMAVCA